jgi:hypothetical protein
MSISWSFSSLKTFQQCPKKYYHLKVAKDVVESDTQATLYGTAVHTAAEEFIRDDKPLPPQFSYMQTTLETLKAIPGEKHCELRLGVTEDLKPTGFLSENTWWRGIADLVVINQDKGVAYSVDYKTGKNSRYADTKQLDLVATGLFAKFPEIKKIKSALLFVVTKELIRTEHKAEDVEKYMEKPRQDVARIQAALDNGVWNPKESALCRFCPVSQCEHNRSE